VGLVIGGCVCFRAVLVIMARAMAVYVRKDSAWLKLVSLVESVDVDTVFLVAFLMVVNGGLVDDGCSFFLL
jgi:hypothetical protein